VRVRSFPLLPDFRAFLFKWPSLPVSFNSLANPHFFTTIPQSLFRQSVNSKHIILTTLHNPRYCCSYHPLAHLPRSLPRIYHSLSISTSVPLGGSSSSGVAPSPPGGQCCAQQPFATYRCYPARPGAMSRIVAIFLIVSFVLLLLVGTFVTLLATCVMILGNESGPFHNCRNQLDG
jgi:hypothetical protein